MKSFRIVALGALLVTLATGQVGTKPRPVFEVASVKVSATSSARDIGGGPGTADPGQFHAFSTTLLEMIATAYHVDRFQVISKSTLDRQHYDVVAKVPEGTDKEQFRTMLQNLLVDRFHLKFHTESREFSGWELTISKLGLKLKESTLTGENAPLSERPKEGSDGFPVLPPGKPAFIARFTIVDGFLVGRFAAQAQPISTLKGFGFPDDPPILDHTGLTAKYDYRLEFSREFPHAPSDDPKVPPAVDLFRAVEEQLGLKLAAKKLQFEALVVESVDQMPTSN